jgi:hypothetical protein
VYNVDILKEKAMVLISYCENINDSKYKTFVLMNVKNSIPQGRIWWLKLPVAPDNGDRHFSKLFNVDEIKGIIHSRIYPAGDVVQSVWHNKSAMIRYNCIIKNYVIRKITSYIYLLIFTISIWLHVNHFITIKHEKGKCGKICFL